MKISGLTTAAVAAAVICVSPTHAGTFSDPGGKFTASWTTDAAKTAVTFTIEGTTTGWVSLSVTSGGVGHSNGADSFVGWVPDGGAAGTEITVDSHGVDGAQAQHVADAGATPSFTLVSAEQTATTTKFVYTRPVAASDADDVAITNADQTLIWVIGAADGDAAGTYGYHSAYGSFTANLLSDDAGPVVAAGGTGGMDIGAVIGGSVGAILAVGGAAFMYQRNVNAQGMPQAMGGASMMKGGMGGPPPPMGGGGDWQSAQDPTTGNTYYYNAAGEVSWTKPPGM